MIPSLGLLQFIIKFLLQILVFFENEESMIYNF